MDFSNHTFRCSYLGHIMTGSRDKNDPLGESCKTHLIDVYVAAKYGRKTDISNRYINKGLQVEEDSITLYSRVTRKFHLKNETRISNTFIQGCPDLFEGETIKKADHIIDVKSSWDLYTFFRTLAKPVNKMYYWQLQGYMALSGAKKATLAYCLVDTPEQMINDEKRKLLWKMGCTTSENPLFLEACEEIEKAMTYDDIPLKERLKEYVIERNDDDLESLYNKIHLCRTFLNNI